MWLLQFTLDEHISYKRDYRELILCLSLQQKDKQHCGFLITSVAQ